MKRRRGRGSAWQGFRRDPRVEEAERSTSWHGRGFSLRIPAGSIRTQRENREKEENKEGRIKGRTQRGNREEREENRPGKEPRSLGRPAAAGELPAAAVIFRTQQHREIGTKKNTRPRGERPRIERNTERKRGAGRTIVVNRCHPTSAGQAPVTVVTLEAQQYREPGGNREKRRSSPKYHHHRRAFGSSLPLLAFLRATAATVDISLSRHSRRNPGWYFSLSSWSASSKAFRPELIPTGFGRAPATTFPRLFVCCSGVHC